MRFLILLLSFVAFGKPMPLPPDLNRVATYGCSATHSRVPGDNVFWWHIKVNVIYDVGDKWIHIFAIREGNDRKNALKDCEQWMSHMDKALRKVKKTEYQQSVPPDPSEPDSPPEWRKT